MPPKGADFAAVRQALTEQWDRVVAGLAEQDPAGPTRCEGWTVETLDRHLGGGVVGLANLEPAPPPEAAAPGLATWAAALPGLAADVDDQARNGRLPRLAEALPAGRTALASADATATVRQRTGVHRLADAVLFRLVEAVVHGRDAGIEPDPAALRIVVRELARLLAEVHPGRSVEVRVPLLVAVQCLPGPRHSRGTPANVVEADPLAFLDVATGRSRWHAEVSAGRIRSSGTRADLGALMPLVR